MRRHPRVICHMMSSIDGRIVVDRWPQLERLDEYETTADTYRADAWMCGRITMEPFAGASRSEAVIARERRRKGARRADFVNKSARGRLAVAIDPSGRLLWKKNNVDGDHVVAVLSNTVSDGYLAYLRGKGVSYLFAPARGAKRGEVNLALALEKLADAFGIRTLLLEGGGGINGSMLGARLIDEVSLLVAPIADGAVGNATTFDVATGVPASRLALKAVERRAGGIVWLRYRVRRKRVSRARPRARPRRG
jgi:riboflavin biosynthesis pyrimidine reductase